MSTKVIVLLSVFFRIVILAVVILAPFLIIDYFFNLKFWQELIITIIVDISICALFCLYLVHTDNPEDEEL